MSIRRRKNDPKRRPVPKRDLVPLWAPVLWFYFAALFLVLAFWPPTRSWSDWAPRAEMPWTLAFGLAAAPFVALGVRKIMRVRRDPLMAVRRDLLALLRSMPEAGSWLNRDERSVFSVQVGAVPSLRSITLIRVPEDDILAFGREGSTDLVVEAWQANPWEPGLIHRMKGVHVTQAMADSGVIRFPKTSIRQQARAEREARRAGMLFARPDEVRELMALLRASEPVSPDGSDDE